MMDLISLTATQAAAEAITEAATEAANQSVELGAPFTPESFAIAGQMTAIGMLTIFAVLSILWGVLAIFKLVFARPKKQQPVAAPVFEAPAVVAQDNANDEELVAVITAAIAAYRASEESENASTAFKVVSFRRQEGGRPWNSK